MKVSELKDELLDLWVAKALGAEDAKIEDWGGLVKVCVTRLNAFEPVPFLPSTKWSDGGPIIEREDIGIAPDSQGPWKAYKEAKEGARVYTGPTPLIAAMRRYVASKYGESVPCPDKE